MNAAIALDQTGNIAFTNLDKISGRVILRTTRSVDITSIVVKLEGESRSRLLSPPGQNGEKPRPQLEYHKILYKVQTAFPPADVLESRNNMSGAAVYTIPAGTHEYPFSFKIPFNNTCTTQNNQTPTMLSFEGVRPAAYHVKQTLPPTLSGFPGEAEIRYFVKVTVGRHSIFRENPRVHIPFNFFPIEPPRPPPTGAEVFARQRTSLGIAGNSDAPKAKLKGLFSKTPNVPTPSTSPATASDISIDARLPEPAIVTCNSDLPLRLIVKKLTESRNELYLQSLQIALIGYTKIRAHELFRTESTTWVLTSKSNLGIPIGTASDPAGTDIVLDDRYWKGYPLPNNIAPNFTTCNIERTYQLDVRVGFSSVGPSQSASKASNIIIPLRLKTLVYSGIAPPAEVLARMKKTKSSVPAPAAHAMTQKLQMEAGQTSDFGSNQIPISPIEPPESAEGGFPAQPSAAAGTALADEYDDAPPSYEDAIASDLPPVTTGNRPVYAPPPPSEDQVLRQDEKRAWSG